MTEHSTGGQCWRNLIEHSHQLHKVGSDISHCAEKDMEAQTDEVSCQRDAVSQRLCSLLKYSLSIDKKTSETVRTCPRAEEKCSCGPRLLGGAFREHVDSPMEKVIFRPHPTPWCFFL